MESGKVIAEGHVQLPAITPGETGKARFTLPASFREGDVLELEAFDKEGKVSVTGILSKLAKQYFDHKMAQTDDPTSGTGGNRHSNRLPPSN